MKAFLAVLLCLLGAAMALNPFATLDNVRSINRAQRNWHASVTSPTARLTPTEFKNLLGVDHHAAVNDPANPKERHFTALQQLTAPDEFDARKQWPGCQSMSQVRDQSNCGSCWAFGAVEPMSDRECIAHGQDAILSSEDMNSCSGAGSCQGGYPSSAFNYWQRTGVVTEACRPYSLPGCDHHAPNSTNPCKGSTYPTPPCVKKCVNGADYAADKHKGARVYTVRGEANMMAELSTNGPCEAAFSVYEDFMTYVSGIYHHVSGSYLGGHAIRILGYGVENGVKYWLLANSWNENWGEKGYYRMRRGSNECGVEDTIWCGVPV